MLGSKRLIAQFSFDHIREIGGFCLNADFIEIIFLKMLPLEQVASFFNTLYLERKNILGLSHIVIKFWNVRTFLLYFTFYSQNSNFL